VFGLIFIAFALLDITSIRWGSDSRIVDYDGRYSGSIGAR
jgi:hypothetical protein